MEIVTYVLEGALKHKDSMGNGSIIVPGDVQRMSAGTGVIHSEFNASDTEPVHLLQIWIVPKEAGIEPSYEQKRFERADKLGRLCLIASESGGNGAVKIQQDARLYVTTLQPGDRVSMSLDEDRHVWLHVATGEVRLGEHALRAGDGASVSGERSLELIGSGKSESELLLFDLA
jgi:redox-sensitive bicupin YhaK (pirin superfamily)